MLGRENYKVTYHHRLESYNNTVLKPFRLHWYTSHIALHREILGGGELKWKAMFEVKVTQNTPMTVKTQEEGPTHD